MIGLYCGPDKHKLALPRQFEWIPAPDPPRYPAPSTTQSAALPRRTAVVDRRRSNVANCPLLVTARARRYVSVTWAGVTTRATSTSAQSIRLKSSFQNTWPGRARSRAIIGATAAGDPAEFGYLG